MEQKTVRVSDEVWVNLSNLKIATREKTMNDVIKKLLKEKLFDNIKLEELKE